MPTLLVLKGIPASGKTTYALELCREQGYLRINWDSLRESFLGESNFARAFSLKHFEDTVIDISFEFAYQMMQHGYDIVVDNTNLNQRIHNRWKKMAEEFNYEFETKEFNTPLEVCLERDKNRANPVGEKVIRGMYDKYTNKTI